MESIEDDPESWTSKKTLGKIPQIPCSRVASLQTQSPMLSASQYMHSVSSVVFSICLCMIFGNQWPFQSCRCDIGREAQEVEVEEEFIVRVT